MSQEVNLVQSQHGGKKPANQPPPENHPHEATDAEEVVILLSSEKDNSSTNNPIQDNLEDDGLPNSEKKARLGRTPSNVKKMISAFESGLPKVYLGLFGLVYLTFLLLGLLDYTKTISLYFIF